MNKSFVFMFFTGNLLVSRRTQSALAYNVQVTIFFYSYAYENYLELLFTFF